MLRNLWLLVLLGGCSSSPVIVPQLQPNTQIAVPSAQPMTMNPVEWQVLNAEQLRALANKMQKSQVAFLLDTRNYDNLSLNIIEIGRYIQEQKTILDMLKAVIAERAKSNQEK